VWEHGKAPALAKRVRELMVTRGVELGVADLLLGQPPATVAADPPAAATVMMCAMTGYFLNQEYFGAPPGDITAERFTATLAALLTGAP
jgi:hypothetical protein